MNYAQQLETFPCSVCGHDFSFAHIFWPCQISVHGIFRSQLSTSISTAAQLAVFSMAMASTQVLSTARVTRRFNPRAHEAVADRSASAPLPAESKPGARGWSNQ